MREDPKLSFPIKVLDIIPPSGRVQSNLMVMPNAKGTRLAEYMCMSISQGRAQELMQVLQALGKELKLFHQRYNHKKHADFTPSNIFYDQQYGFTFIDVGGIGTSVQEHDVDHFIKSLQITCGPQTPYGPHFNNAVHAFKQGYNSA
jgi:tRNA A-37 threonylcarbamoyl transferase component Bud32